MARRRIIRNHILRVQAEDTNIVLTVQYNELVCAEYDGSNGGSSWRGKGHADSFLAKDIDYAGAECGFIGADRQEGLNWVISQN